MGNLLVTDRPTVPADGYPVGGIPVRWEEQARIIRLLVQRGNYRSIRAASHDIPLNHVSLSQYVRGVERATPRAIDAIVYLEKDPSYRALWRDLLRHAAYHRPLDSDFVAPTNETELLAMLPPVAAAASALGKKRPRTTRMDSETDSVPASSEPLQRYGLDDLPTDMRREIWNLHDTLRSDTVRIPVLGKIAAGATGAPVIPSESVTEDYLYVSRDLLRDAAAEEAFAVRVTGNSMEGEHIVAGELLVVRPQNTANEGEIVVVILADERTCVKIFRNGQSGVTDASAGPYLESHYADGTRTRVELGPEARVVGRVIEIRRRFV